MLAAAAACQELIPRPPPSLLQRKRQGHCEVSISSGSAWYEAAGHGDCPAYLRWPAPGTSMPTPRESHLDGFALPFENTKHTQPFFAAATKAPRAVATRSARSCKAGSPGPAMTEQACPPNGQEEEPLCAYAQVFLAA